MPDDAPLHVGLVAPLWHPIGPDRGGVEQIVSLLAGALVADGHQLTLVATGDSQVPGHLVSVCKEGLVRAMLDGRVHEYAPYELVAIREALRLAPQVDVLHSHLGTGLVPFVPFARAPILHTVHTSISADMRWLLERCPGARTSTVSRWQAEALADLVDADVVPNGIDVAAYPFANAPDEYLLVLGRIEPRKGFDVAIAAARTAGRSLVIAGPVTDPAYFETRIRPHLDGERVRAVGPVRGAEKVALLQRARGLLFPVQWEEGFGLVMVEAMACGTPVVALARGAVAEIVVPGENGFLTADEAELPALIARLPALDRATVRASVAERFSHHRMTQDYVACYRRLLAEPPAPPRSPAPGGGCARGR